MFGISSLFTSSNYANFAPETAVSARIEVLTPTGVVFPAYKGIDHLEIQHNPTSLELPESLAEYVETKAIGRHNAILQFTGRLIQETEWKFYLTDYFDGPPHSIKGSDGSIIPTDFTDLYEVQHWLLSLQTMLEGFYQPPHIRLIWGPYMDEGVLTSLNSKVLKMYPDGFPKLINVSLRYKPDPIIVYEDRDKLKVK